MSKDMDRWIMNLSERVEAAIDLADESIREARGDAVRKGPKVLQGKTLPQIFGVLGVTGEKQTLRELDAIRELILKAPQGKQSSRPAVSGKSTGPSRVPGDSVATVEASNRWIEAYRGIQEERKKAGRPIGINEAIELARVEHPEVYETYRLEATR